MTVYEAATSRRTIRKFRPEPIPANVLRDLVNAARLAPSAANLQPLKYIIVDETRAEALFPWVKWAAYIAPAGNPQPGEHPMAYVIVLADTEIRKTGWELDAGASCENLMLSAWEQGIGSCWMAAIDRDGIRKTFEIPERYEISTVIALGYAAERSDVVDMTDSVKYYKLENGELRVPKRTLEEIIL